jgi:fatty acid desaturase
MTVVPAATPRTRDEVRFVREAHALVRDLLEPHPRRYWIDGALTSLVAYAALAVYLRAPAFSVRQGAALLVAALAMYRAAVFIHEIVHRPAGSFGAFTVAWNVACGIPLFMPSFLYGDHRGHHARTAYGTRADPEYILVAWGGGARVVAFLALALVYPALGVLRFLVLTPLALVSRRLDGLIWTHASSLYNMNESYRRPWDAEAGRPARWMQELAACAWAWSLVALVATQRVAWSTLGKVYVVFLLWMLLNQVRTLAAHRYSNRPARPLTHGAQVADTNTFAHGRWLPALWAPLGMRYHALHHLVPALPYHAMPQAHRRLMAALPPDSPYRATLQPGLGPALAAILGEGRG